ncbi:MAG TPA: hypothetical protein VKT32_10180 [Chthonomonadaceae bacterium]|nr:hypothetical protein [Chthonomonadaceae bacterium]
MSLAVYVALFAAMILPFAHRRAETTIRPPEKPGVSVTYVAFLDARRLMVAYGSWEAGRLPGQVGVWDVRTGRQERLLLPQVPDLRAVAVSPDGLRMATGGLFSNTLQVWDLREHKPVATLTSDPYAQFAFSQEGRTLALITEQPRIEFPHIEVDLYALPSGTMRPLEGSEGTTALAFSPAGPILAIALAQYHRPFVLGGDNPLTAQVRLLDTTTGQAARTLEGGNALIRWLVFSQDGQRLAACCAGGTIRVWSAGTGNLLQTVKEEGVSPFVGGPGLQGAAPIAFSPDGHRLASALNAGQLSLWNLDTASLEKTFRNRSPWALLLNCAFSADGKTLAVGGTNGCVWVWDIASGRLKRRWTLKCPPQELRPHAP